MKDIKAAGSTCAKKSERELGTRCKPGFTLLITGINFLLLFLFATTIRAQMQSRCTWNVVLELAVTNYSQSTLKAILGPDGSLYVSCHMRQYQTSDQTWVTFKYSAEGKGVWTNYYHYNGYKQAPFGPTDILLDCSNNVYLCGPSIVGYDNSGKQILDIATIATSAATCNNCDIFFAFGGGKFRAAEYAGNGQFTNQWELKTPREAHAQAVVLGRDGHINVIGSQILPGTTISNGHFTPTNDYARILLVTCDASGIPISTNWSKGDGALLQMSLIGTTLDDEGNIYILYDCVGVNGRSLGFQVAKFASSGGFMGIFSCPPDKYDAVPSSICFNGGFIFVSTYNNLAVGHVLLGGDRVAVDAFKIAKDLHCLNVNEYVLSHKQTVLGNVMTVFGSNILTCASFQDTNGVIRNFLTQYHDFPCTNAYVAALGLPEMHMQVASVIPNSTNGLYIIGFERSGKGKLSVVMTRYESEVCGRHLNKSQ